MITNIIEKILEIFEYLLISVLIFLIVYVFIAQLVQVSGDSMNPTFNDKQQLIAEKVSVVLGDLNYTDVVIFNSIEEDDINNSHLLIKRIIGLPGDKIKIENGFVYLNDNRLQEDYLPDGVYTNLKPNNKIIEGEEYIIGEDSYFVMGDNRDESNDSRYFGTLHKNDILAKVVARYYPFEDFKIFK